MPAVAVAKRSLSPRARPQLLVALGAQVREQRREAHVTQRALAEALGITVAYVSLIERGLRNPPYTTVVAMAHALGVRPSRLVSS